MDRLPSAAQVYVWLVVVAGALLIGVSSAEPLAHPWLFLTLLAISCGTAPFKLRLPIAGTRGTTMSMSWAVDVTALMVLGPAAAVLIAAASGACQCLFNTRERAPLHRTLFSATSLAVTMWTAGLVYAVLGGTPGSAPQAAAAFALAVTGTAATHLAVNMLLVSVVVALAQQRSTVRIFGENVLWSAPGYGAGAIVAGVSAWIAIHSTPALAGVALAPLALVHYTYQLYLRRLADASQRADETARLHLATIEALALAIDAKDSTAQPHVHRVSVFAAGLARACGMSPSEIEGVRTAAVLHDIGKLAVPEHILSKPGPLTQEEFQKVRIHPEVGAGIISRVPFPYPVAALIACHHERWDGKGYPAGLRQEEIPLGARILAVVDYFDALISERPYHKAHSRQAAIDLLRRDAGQALDPRLVDVFLDLLPRLEAEAAGIRDADRAPAGEAAERRDDSEIATRSAFDHIALAHRELYALYDIAQTLGTSLGVADTMRVVSAKLSNLVPFSACALFLYAEDTDSLICRFATGADSEALRRLVVPAGHGVTGWVARARRPMVNGRPSADLEAAGSGAPVGLQSSLVCPLVYNERVIGTLAVYHEQADFYTDDDRRLLDRVAEQAGAVVYNSVVFEQTQEDSLTDALTALPNARSLFMHLRRDLARAERLKSHVSVVVMDLDSFKEINDSHGHAVGDRALGEVANVLRRAIRPYDVCARYAGDEFVVVLSGCGFDEATHKLQELQEALDGIGVEVSADETIELAISAGAATYPTDGLTYEALLAAADRRMYRDKASRKIRTVSGHPHRSGTLDREALAEPIRRA